MDSIWIFSHTMQTTI